MGRYSPEYMTRHINEPMTLPFITQAIKDGAILEARVISCDADYTLTLDLGKNILGTIKIDEFEFSVNEHKVNTHSAEYSIYRHVKFIPLSITKNNGIYTVECSRKKAQEICFNNYIKNLEPGDIIDATITRINRYGVFCDIGCGITALLPTNNISVTHVIDVNAFLKNVHNLKVIVKSIDENYRIQLTHKELLGTWKEEVENIHRGDIICGTVLSVEEYGVFIRISQNLSGLADVSALELNTGDKVLVRVTLIKEESMKVKLVIISKVDDDNEKLEVTQFNYRIKDSHINEWHYSTPTAKRQISSCFE